MADDSQCVFCKILHGTIPGHFVARCDQFAAFLDVGPLAKGHLLVIPCDHYESLTDVPPDVMQSIGAALPALGRALLSVTEVDAFNVLLNSGKTAGQVVPHVHFHLIPRVPDDALGYRWPAGSYEPGEAEALARQFKEILP